MVTDDAFRAAYANIGPEVDAEAIWSAAGESPPDEDARHARTALLTLALEGAEQVIRARIYAELGNDHYAIFGADAWFTEHSVECRLAGQMATCAYHEAVSHIAGPGLSGRWRITGIDSEGLPEMERADA